MSRDNPKKRVLNKRLLVLSISLSGIIIFGFVAYKVIFQNQQIKFSMKAAIVDQLSGHFQNSTFIARATSLLMNAGFNVSYFSSDNVTVQFYKELIEGNYGIIIFRAHSALRNNTNIVDLFTSEEYSEGAYSEYNNLLSIAKYLVSWMPGANQSYFAVTPNFIEKFGRFPHSIIVAMGCSSLKPGCYGLAEAFLDKGAKAYIGWNETVYPEHTDHETAIFLDFFLNKNYTLASAIDATNAYRYYDDQLKKYVWTKMDYYPSLAMNLKISDLIAETETKASIMFNGLEVFPLLIISVNLNQKVID